MELASLGSFCQRIRWAGAGLCGYITGGTTAISPASSACCTPPKWKTHLTCLFYSQGPRPAELSPMGRVERAAWNRGLRRVSPSKALTEGSCLEIFFWYISLGKRNKGKNKHTALHQLKACCTEKETINKMKKKKKKPLYVRTY